MIPPTMLPRRRTLAWLALLPLGVVLISLVYMLGMDVLEGRPRDFWHSLGWTAETLTTTGYGHDNQWRHPLMVVFVVAMQFLGVFLAFLLIPIFAVPYFERRLEERLPTAIPPKLADFVLIYRHGPAVTSLIRDLEHQRIPTVVLEEDEALARRLRSEGLTVVYVRPEDEKVLPDALARARVLIVNGEDHDNVVTVLSARQSGFKRRIHAFVQNPKHRKPVVLAGADNVYSPKHALAAGLAAQASQLISPRVAGLQQLGEHVQVAELRVHRESPVADIPLARSAIREQTGATIVGLWVRGSFTSEIGPNTILRRGAILVAIGSADSIERLGRLATPLVRTGPFVVAGYGEVGCKVVEMLGDAGERTVVIDREESEGVDLVADALDSEALVQAGVKEAQAVILALSSDSTNLFAATIVRDLAHDVPIIARVGAGADVGRIRAAGADFALSISQVAGQLLGRQLLGEEFVSLEPSMRLVKVSAAGVEGLTPVSARIRERSGCSIVALERDGKLLVEFDPELKIRSGDCVYLCGSAEAVSRYFDLFPGARDAEMH